MFFIRTLCVMKSCNYILILLTTLLFCSCSFFEKQLEAKREPLKIYIEGNEFGFGAIMYVEKGFQKSNQLLLDTNNIGITSYPYSSLIQQSGEEEKYQFFRIVDGDTIRQVLGGHSNDSTNISSAIPTSKSLGKMKYTYKFIKFYAGKYPERPTGIHIDSTVVGQFDNVVDEYIRNLYSKKVKPQEW